MLRTQGLPETTERRRAARLGCLTAIPMARVGAALDNATILNISAQGIAADVAQEIRPDTHLTIELFNQRRAFWHVKVMRVIYATPQDEGTWRVGCSFLSPLPDCEVQELLGQAKAV